MLIVILGFSEAVGLDVIHHLRPDIPLRHSISLPSFWVARAYGVVLGIPFSIGLIYISEAEVAGHSLSAKYRQNMLNRWTKTRSKIEAKLALPLSAPEESESLSAGA